MTQLCKRHNTIERHNYTVVLAAQHDRPQQASSLSDTRWSLPTEHSCDKDCNACDIHSLLVPLLSALLLHPSLSLLLILQLLYAPTTSLLPLLIPLLFPTFLVLCLSPTFLSLSFLFLFSPLFVISIDLHPLPPVFLCILILVFAFPFLSLLSMTDCCQARHAI